MAIKQTEIRKLKVRITFDLVDLGVLISICGVFSATEERNCCSKDGAGITGWAGSEGEKVGCGGVIGAGLGVKELLSICLF